MAKKKTFTEHTDSISEVAFTANGKHFLSSSHDKTVKIWELPALQSQITLIEQSNSRNGMAAFSPGGKYLSTNGAVGSEMEVWSTEGELKHSFKDDSPAMEMAISPDGQSFLTCNYDTSAKLWSLDGELIRSFQSPDNNGMAAAFSSDGQHILACSGGKAWLWDRQGNVVQSIPKESVTLEEAVGFSPDGRHFMLGRSLPDLVKLVNFFDTKGTEFQSLQDQIDTSTPVGQFTFHIFAAVAQFERGIIQMRTFAGLKAARARGRFGGRPKGLSKSAENRSRGALPGKETLRSANLPSVRNL